jgi:rhamnosyltransferase subunit B
MEIEMAGAPGGMRRIILITLGSAGDVHPFVALGRGLAARGHRVSLATSASFEETVRGEGLEFLTLAPRGELEGFLADPDVWHPRRGVRILVEKGIVPFVPRTYALIEPLARERPLLVGSILALGARVAQERLGLSLVTVQLQPFGFFSFDHPPVMPGFDLRRFLPRPLARAFLRGLDLALDRIAGEEINRFRARLGLPRARHLFTLWPNSPQKVVGLFPPWFAPPGSAWPANAELAGFVRYDRGDGAGPPDAVRAFLEAGEPPVLFTPGTAMLHGAAFFSAAVEACRRAGRRGILLTAHRDHLPRVLPGSIAHFDYVPFSQVLPRCAAFVHHGGIGSLAQGLAAGVPQLVMPLAFDQHDNAARLSILGAGEVLPPARFTGPAAAEALARITGSPAVRERCRGLAKGVDFEAALARACDVICRTAAS